MGARQGLLSTQLRYTVARLAPDLQSDTLFTLLPSPPPITPLRSAPEGTPGAPGAEGEGGAPGAAPNLTSNRRLQQTQAQVDEVHTCPKSPSPKKKTT